MSMFGDLHQLTAGLEHVKVLTKATIDLTIVCTELHHSVERLAKALEENNRLIKSSKKVKNDNKSI